MLTFTEFSGTPYHIGLALGRFGATAMHTVIKPSALWEGLMQWLDTDELKALQEKVQQQHPYIWDELQGLARGLELHPDEIFLWNSQGALPVSLIPAVSDTSAVHPIGYTAVESTTQLLPTPEGPRIVHRMSGDPELAEYCAVAEFIVDQGPEFAAFISPGLLPGHAVAVTGSGLGMAVNAGLPQHPGIGIPPVVLTRALLNMPDMSAAIQFLNESLRCGSLHLSLAQRGTSAILSIDVSADTISIQHTKEATLHTNPLILDNAQDPEQGVPGRVLMTADLHIGAEEVLWDVYEGINEPARFRMRDARHI